MQTPNCREDDKGLQGLLPEAQGCISVVPWLIGSPARTGMGKKTESQTLRCRRVNPGSNLHISPTPCLFWGIAGFLVPSELFPPGLVLTEGCLVHQPYQLGTRKSRVLRLALLKTGFLPPGHILINGGRRGLPGRCASYLRYLAPSYIFRKRLKTCTDSFTL